MNDISFEQIVVKVAYVREDASANTRVYSGDALDLCDIIEALLKKLQEKEQV